jgi:hypothetical protein
MKIPDMCQQTRDTLKHLALATVVGASFFGTGPDANAAPPVSGYVHWFDASTLGLANDADVTEWPDGGSSGGSATVPDGNATPVYVANAGTETGLGAIYFAKNNDANDSAAFRFTRDTEIRTVFSVFKGSAFLLTDVEKYNFHRPNDDNPAEPLIADYDAAAIVAGQTYVNKVLVDPTNDPMPTDVHNGFNLVEILTDGGAVNADSFNKDRSFHAGDQYQAEVIIYDRVLNEEERLAVEDYLFFKWFNPGPPPAPTGLVATPWHHSIHLTWDATPGASGYKVDRLLGSGLAIDATYDASGTSYTDTSATVDSGGPYYYVVRAVNTAGSGDPSAEASASPSADPVDQTITFALGAAIAKWSSAAPFADTATSTSGRAVTYSVPLEDQAVATVDSSGLVTLTGTTGTARIWADCDADADFNAAHAEQLLTVSPLTTDAGQSTVAVSLPSLWADGFDYSTLTVTLKNADGVVVPDKAVTLTSSRPTDDTVSGTPGTSDANGVVTFTVKSSTVGSATYTAKDTTADVTLSTTAIITYVAAPTPFTSYVAGSTEFQTWDFHGSTYAGWDHYRNTIITDAGIQMGAPVAGNADHGAWVGMIQSTADLSTLPFDGFGVEIKFNAPNMVAPTDSLELLTVRSTQEDPREGFGISGNGNGGSIRATSYMSGDGEVNFGSTNDLVGCHTMTLVRTGTTVRTYVDGRVMNTRTTTDPTNPMLHFGLGLNEYNGNSYWPVGAVVSKITAFTVTPPTEPAVINVALGARGNTDSTAITRYGAYGNYMNGTLAGATAAPLTYSGNTWNDKPESGSNLLDSNGFITTVGFTTPQYKGYVGDWWDTPGVLKLSDGAARHADAGWGGGWAPDEGTIPSILLTGLDTAKTYQLAIVLPGRDERTVNFNVGGTVVAGTDPYFWTMSGGTTTTATNPANLSAFVANQNYVLLTGLTPNGSGEIQVYAERIAGEKWALAGFQLTEVTTPSTPAAIISEVTPSQSVPVGNASVLLQGKVSDGGTVYPAEGETVTITIGTASQDTTIADTTGGFSVLFLTGSIPASTTPYTITYSYAGNGTTLGAATPNTSTTLTVNSTYLAWIEGYFPTPGDPNAEPGADPDKDGKTNQEEYAFGLNPDSATSVDPITEQLNKTTGIFKYTRQEGTGLNYSIYTSSTLANDWALDDSAGQEVISTSPEGVQTVRVTLSGSKPLAATSLFVRVKASPAL